MSEQPAELSVSDCQQTHDLLRENPYRANQIKSFPIGGTHWQVQSFWRACFLEPASRPHSMEVLSGRLRRTIEAIWEQEASHGSASTQEEKARLATLYFAWLATVYGHQLGTTLRGEKGILHLDESQQATVYQGFEKMVRHDCGRLSESHCLEIQPAHLFARLHQVGRTFICLETYEPSPSQVKAELKMQIWRAAFGIRPRWLSFSHGRLLSKTPVILNGAIGEEKEWVLQVLAESQFRDWDTVHSTFSTKRAGFMMPQLGPMCFDATLVQPGLIEASLFGAAKPGALGLPENHKGLVERCRADSILYIAGLSHLDEVTCARLHQLIQQGQWSKTGEHTLQPFHGLLVLEESPAINADNEQTHPALLEAVSARRLDLPPLDERMRDVEERHHWLLRLMSDWIDEAEVSSEVKKLSDLMDHHLGTGYSWPGHFAELKRCVTHYCLQGESPKSALRQATSTLRPEDLSVLEALQDGKMSANQWLSQYCTRIYARTKNYEEAARILSMDRRTVKARIDAELLNQLTADDNGVQPPAGGRD